jgi:hypothetical protein
MLDRIISALVALSLAMLVWLYARSREQETLDDVPVPVQVTLPPGQEENYALDIAGPPQVLVSFSGPPGRIRELRGVLQRGELKVELAYAVPDDRMQEGRIADTLRVEASDVHVPLGVTVRPVEGRNRVPLVIHRLIERRLPVRFDHDQFEPIPPVEIDPPSVVVRGPQEVLERARVVPTQPAAWPTRPAGSGAHGAVIARVALVAELEGRPIRTEPSRVTVRVQGQPRKVYELAEVPVHFLCPPNLTLRPRFIDERAGKLLLKVEGPAQDEPPRIHAFIDLTRGRFAAGLNHEPLQIQLPRDFALAQEAPRVLAFELLPAETVPKPLGVLPPMN